MNWKELSAKTVTQPFTQRTCLLYSQLCADIKSLQLRHTFSSILLSGLIQPLPPHAKSENAGFCVVLNIIVLELLTNQSLKNDDLLLLSDGE